MRWRRRTVPVAGREAQLAQVLPTIEWVRPEHRLLAAIITRAVLDYERGGKNKETAEAYLRDRSGIFTEHCAQLNLSSRYIQRLVGLQWTDVCDG